MAYFDSEVSKFLIDDTGSTERDISAYIVSIDGLPGPRELNDATTLNQSGRIWHPTLENVVITLELLYDDTATTGPEAILGPLRTHTAAVDFAYGPKGNTSTYLKYSGTCWVKNLTLPSRVGNMISMKCELQVNGVVTRGTFT